MTNIGNCFIEKYLPAVVELLVKSLLEDFRNLDSESKGEFQSKRIFQRVIFFISHCHFDCSREIHRYVRGVVLFARSKWKIQHVPFTLLLIIRALATKRNIFSIIFSYPVKQYFFPRRGCVYWHFQADVDHRIETDHRMRIIVFWVDVQVNGRARENKTYATSKQIVARSPELCEPKSYRC